MKYPAGLLNFISFFAVQTEGKENSISFGNRVRDESRHDTDRGLPSRVRARVRGQILLYRKESGGTWPVGPACWDTSISYKTPKLSPWTSQQTTSQGLKSPVGHHHHQAAKGSGGKVGPLTACRLRGFHHMPNPKTWYVISLPCLVSSDTLHMKFLSVSTSSNSWPCLNPRHAPEVLWKIVTFFNPFLHSTQKQWLCSLRV